MDFAKIIIEFLGLQDVKIKDVKLFKKRRVAEIYVCSHSRGSSATKRPASAMAGRATSKVRPA